MNARAGYSGKINIQICITGSERKENTRRDFYNPPTYFFRTRAGPKGGGEGEGGMDANLARPLEEH
jgi:hypothetical protein